jgi:predicted ATPase
MALGQVLQPDGANLSAWLMWLQAHSTDSFIRLSEVLQDLFPGLTQVKVIPTPDGNVHLTVSERGLKRPTFVWQMSDGFLALSALLSLIYVPSALSGSVFCVEEPENHLHPRILETLVALLNQVRQQARASGESLTQLFVTTQSPYLLDQFSIDDIIWVQKHDGQTRATRPADKKALKKLVEDKELGLGQLMYSGVLGNGK